MADQEFIGGLFAKKPSEKAPDFVRTKLSIKTEDLRQWLDGRSEEWINADVLETKDGSKHWIKIDDYKPEGDAPEKNPEPTPEPEKEEIDIKDIPF